MTQYELIQTLKNEAASNPAANAVFHMFALRKRARHQVTLHSLSQRMRAEGFTYDTATYASLLKLLAKVGVGRLDTDAKGRVRALKDVKTKLQSLGAAVCSNSSAKLDSFRQKNRFSDLSFPEPVKAPAIPELKPAARLNAVSITVSINGKNIVVPVPKELNSEEIALLVNNFKD